MRPNYCPGGMLWIQRHGVHGYLAEKWAILFRAELTDSSGSLRKAARYRIQSADWQRCTFGSLNVSVVHEGSFGYPVSVHTCKSRHGQLIFRNDLTEVWSFMPNTLDPRDLLSNLTVVESACTPFSHHIFSNLHAKRQVRGKPWRTEISRSGRRCLRDTI